MSRRNGPAAASAPAGAAHATAGPRRSAAAAALAALVVLPSWTAGAERTPAGADPSGAGSNVSCAVPADLQVRPQLPGLSRALATEGATATIIVLDALASGPRRPETDILRWPVRLQAELATRLPTAKLRVETVGRRQADVAQLAALVSASVLPRRPTLVVWPISRNDLRQGVPPNRFGERLRTGLEALRREGIDTIVLDIAYHPQSEALMRSDEYRRYVRWIAEDAGAWRMRRFEMIEHWADRGGADFDSTDRAVQAEAVDVVQRCVAEQLAEMIVAGVPGPSR